MAGGKVREAMRNKRESRRDKYSSGAVEQWLSERTEEGQSRGRKSGQWKKTRSLGTVMESCDISKLIDGGYLMWKAKIGNLWRLLTK